MARKFLNLSLLSLFALPVPALATEQFSIPKWVTSRASSRPWTINTIVGSFTFRVKTTLIGNIQNRAPCFEDPQLQHVK